MQLEKVRLTFEKKGYTPNAYIDKREYFRLLSSLVQGGQFHEQVADQLWTQAAGQRPSRQLRVNQICTTIVDAQNILKTKIQQTIDQINALQTEKRRLQSAASPQAIRRIQQIDMSLEQKYGEKQSFQDDFRLVTEPFGIQMLGGTGYRLSASSNFNPIPNPNINNSYTSAAADQGLTDGYQSQNPQKIQQAESEGLKYALYLTLVFGFIQIIMIYGKPDFLNLIVLTCLLCIYLMNFFDRVYIRLTLALIAASVVLDFVWLIMYAGPKWNPPQVGNQSIYRVGYTRFIVFFTVALIPLKIGLFFFLFKHRNAESQQKHVVSLGIMKIILSANKSNPISKGLSNAPVLSQ